MRTAFFLAAALAVVAPLAHAEDMAEMISKYRRAHGLSTVKFDPELTKVAERQAKAMAASGIMDHSVAGSFSSRVSGAHITGGAAENIAAGSKSWEETMQMWKTSSGHNANLLLSQADTVGVAYARNDSTRYKTFWAMVIADKSPKKKGSGNKFTEEGGPFGSSGHGGSYSSLGNPISAVTNFVCKYLC
jgi:hypothetical protein